jgi:hypothetical protein
VYDSVNNITLPTSHDTLTATLKIKQRDGLMLMEKEEISVARFLGYKFLGSRVTAYVISKFEILDVSLEDGTEGPQTNRCVPH